MGDFFQSSFFFRFVQCHVSDQLNLAERQSRKPEHDSCPFLVSLASRTDAERTGAFSQNARARRRSTDTAFCRAARAAPQPCRNRVLQQVI